MLIHSGICEEEIEGWHEMAELSQQHSCESAVTSHEPKAKYKLEDKKSYKICIDYSGSRVAQ